MSMNPTDPRVWLVAFSSGRGFYVKDYDNAEEAMECVREKTRGCIDAHDGGYLYTAILDGVGNCTLEHWHDEIDGERADEARGDRQNVSDYYASR